jgi:transposase-like protein
MLFRRFTVSHECMRQWEAELVPIMGAALRKRRCGSGRRSALSWYVDETYLKVDGRWYYLYRAIDTNLIDTKLSATRDMKAAQKSSAPHGRSPVLRQANNRRVSLLPGAIRSMLGRDVRHRTNVYLNN